MPETKHPAVYSESVLDMGAKLITLYAPMALHVLDVFGGIGKIADLAKRGLDLTYLVVELQLKWVRQALARGCLAILANSKHLPFNDGEIQLIFSSPVYGNRISDNHKAKDGSHRITYTHYYGEDLHPENAGQMYFWQKCYKVLHRLIILEMWRVLEDGGVVIWNTKPFYRTTYPKGVSTRVFYDVTEWFIKEFLAANFELIDRVRVPVKGMKKGANRETRVPYEDICVFRKKKNVSLIH